jgi:beta-lactamase class D
MSAMKPPIAATLLTLCLAACSPAPSPPPAVSLLDVPAAAGATAPNMVTGPEGTTVLSWIEPAGDGHALRYSVLQEAGWGPANQVARGDNWFVNWADFPSVVPLGGAMWAAHWLVSQPEGGYAYDVNVALSTDSGATWSAPFLPHFDGTPTEHGFVSLFPDSGGVGLVWLDGRKMVSEYDENDVAASGMTLRTATFGEDQTPIRSAMIDDLTCDCCQTDVVLTPDGPIAVYRDRTVGEIRDIYVSRRAFGEWQPGVPVAEDRWEIPACPVNGPVIRASGDQVVVAWFTAANDVPLVKAAWSDDRGKTFAAPVIVGNDIPLGHVGAVLLPDGDLVVGWHERAGEGEARLALRRTAANGDRSDVYYPAIAPDIFAFSVPQLAYRDDAIVVAWTNSADNNYSVASAIIPLGLIGGVAATTVAAPTDSLSDVFSGKPFEATMIVASLDGSEQFVHNAPRSRQRMSPASTFKVPNSLIGLDQGVVTSKDSTFTWDGTDRGVEAWNKDQTLESALQVSCVWCYQEIARAVGGDEYRRALAAINYGNANIGEAVDQFWLNGDLQISAQEQIDFLRSMLHYELPYSREHVDLVKDIMLVESGTDYAVHAKSGWIGASLAVGWYVGFVTTDEDTWVFAMNMHLDKVEDAPLRQALTLEALRALNII